MAFIDPQTVNWGMYTGQVNSLNYKQDGMGMVYYARGSIAKGTWANRILVENKNGGGMKLEEGDGSGMASELERMAGPPKIGRGGGGVGGGYCSGPSPSHHFSIRNGSLNSSPLSNLRVFLIRNGSSNSSPQSNYRVVSKGVENNGNAHHLVQLDY
jgi:hypothetical protein